MTIGASGPTPPIPDALPVLPLAGMVVFPMAIAPLLVGQERSIKLIDDVMQRDKLIALVARKGMDEQIARPDELYSIGTVATIHQLLRGEDGTMRLLVQGIERVHIDELLQTDPYFVARIRPAPEVEFATTETEALARSVRELFRKLLSLVPEFPNELSHVTDQLTDLRQLVYLVGATAPLAVEARQELLTLDPISAKLRKLVDLLQHELAVRELEQKITADTEEELTKRQREHLLRERMRAIQRELGEEDSEQAAARELRDKFESLPLSDDARKEIERELSRLERMPSASPEYGMIRTWLEWMVNLPWGLTTGTPIDVKKAREVLDEDHHDLELVKERILELLAVKKLREERHPEVPLTGEGIAGGAPVAGPIPQTPEAESRREPILCFVGPPGVGKTSLGQSIARAMDRKFVRISLGGVHDEAEIRGHRRTYIGAMPGRILQALRRAGAADTVFMLDEIDKLGVGFQGDPSAALLEVLDPAQNKAFVDSYLGLPFDLSRVLFICTANNTDPIPPPLLDRMEVLRLAGYTDLEKLFIARKYLFPKLLVAHGLKEDEVTIDDKAIRRVMRDYTREAGVRNLERSLATILRKIAMKMTEGEAPPFQVGPDEVTKYLGHQKFFDEAIERIDRPGIATGLAWTPVGGDVLFVEATAMKAREEKLILTGMLGDVMRESAQAALSFVRSNADKLGIPASALEGKAIHLHVPAGAIPKDGPSAGVAMMAALASLASGAPVRADVAMTGEITLRGKVLRVGGVKEKVLAAERTGITHVILPRYNQAELDEVPEELRNKLQFHFVDTAEEALGVALVPREIERDWMQSPPAPSLPM